MYYEIEVYYGVIGSPDKAGGGPGGVVCGDEATDDEYLSFRSHGAGPDPDIGCVAPEATGPIDGPRW